MKMNRIILLAVIVLASCSGGEKSKPIGPQETDGGWMIPIAIPNQWTYRINDGAEYTVSINKSEVLFWKNFTKTSTLVSNNNMAFIVLNDTLYLGSVATLDIDDPIPFPRDPTNNEILDEDTQRKFVYVSSITVPYGEFTDCWGESINGRIINWYKQNVGLIKKYDPVTKSTHELIDYTLY